MSMHQRYEKIRQRCLQYGNFHPKDESVCHKAIHVSNADSLSRALALELDDMYIAYCQLERELSAQWRPIKTAPKDGTRIIVASKNGHVWCDVKWEKMIRVPDRWTSFLGPLPFNPTHWQPLPPPPKG